MNRVYVGKSELGTPNFPLNNLTRHCVILGSTGSGKTGVGINILESCLLNNVPVIAIDPKGDIGNLLYMPTELNANEFKAFDNYSGDVPIELHEGFARGTKENWVKWGIPLNLGGRLLRTVDFRLYTPGESYGLPMGLFGEENGAREALDRVDEASALSQSMLNLMGIKSGSTGDHKGLLERAIWEIWEDKQQITPALVAKYLPSDGLYESETRLLYKRLMTLDQSFTFLKWKQKPTLNIDRLFRNGVGTPLCSILNIVHLQPEEQQFFLGVLLSKLVTWMKTQPASNELKAVLYIDECQGLIPAVNNPVTKNLLMTLIKQARAFGLGIILATQNPGDIDYKALSNVGTWITGLLKTDRDRKKVSEAINLEDRGIIAGLKKREFIYSDTFSGEESRVFQSRQTICYMKGPMDQKEIERVTKWRKLEGLIDSLDLDEDQKIHEITLRCIYLLHYFNPSDNENTITRMMNHLAWQVKEYADQIKEQVTV